MPESTQRTKRRQEKEKQLFLKKKGNRFFAVVKVNGETLKETEITKEEYLGLKK